MLPPPPRSRHAVDGNCVYLIYSVSAEQGEEKAGADIDLFRADTHTNTNVSKRHPEMGQVR